MPRTKISKVARALNIGLQTAVDFLEKNGIAADANPNAKIDDGAVMLLIKEYKPSADAKALTAEIMAAPSRPAEPAPAPHPRPAAAAPKTTAAPAASAEKPVAPVTEKPATPSVGGVRILGHIDLDRHGNPVRKPAAQAPAPKPAPAKATESAAAKAAEPAKPSEPAKEVKPAEPVKPAAPAPKPAEPVKEAKPAEPAPKPAEPAKEPAAKPAEPAKPAAPAPKPAEPVKESKPAEPVKPAEPAKEAAPAEPEVFTLPNAPERPQLNIIGKINLDALNQSTRPKKKPAQGQRGGNGAGAQGDRKKRKRITGKEKVDIEKTSQQIGGSENRDNREGRGGQGGEGRNRQGGGERNRQGGEGRNRQGGEKGRGSKRGAAPQHVEVREEDVQKQVKETLARLTQKDKNQKKGAKWRKEKREAFQSREREAEAEAAAESRILKLTEFVTANDLAVMMDVPVNNVIATCMNIGVMVSINQRLDAETINIVAEEFGFKTEYVSAEVVEAIGNDVEDTEDQLVTRPPIVTVMGHVDHGKTSLLDYIRNANVIAGEAGGITQHIGAYNVGLSDGRHITFLDTPGHEAFTAMRARGAKVTDLCIIIVAADDNVMPQTVEAINHASAAGVPIVFAINKIDKPHANPDKIKEELAAMNYLVEDWGGKYQSQDISAKKGIGVDELMEKVLLEAEMLDLKANPDRPATGSIIESSLDKGRGYVATVLVQNGTLRVGDIILAGTHHGRIKAMFNERNQRIKEAGPAEPALILGLNGAPTAGDTFNVMDSEQEAREIANKREQLQRELGLRTSKRVTLEDIGRRRAIGNFQELNIIVKGDVDGSIEALSDSLIKLSTDEVQVNVIHKAVGEISESDVTLAAASDAIIIGFQVRPSVAARRAAERDGVQIRLYSVIYQAIEEVKDAMEGMLAPEIKEEVTGSAEVLQTYHISKVGTIAGAIVREGRIKRSCKVRLIREGIVRYTGELGSLKRFKDDVKEVVSGYDCGLSIANYNDLREGDIIEAFEEVEVKKTL
ncbi:MAG: translation initiation factor IF-2 [Paramuribaculum sp.]|nr:translation initiation factor IF-2 [Paramuribaculum sp.]